MGFPESLNLDVRHDDVGRGQESDAAVIFIRPHSALCERSPDRDGDERLPAHTSALMSAVEMSSRFRLSRSALERASGC